MNDMTTGSPLKILVTFSLPMLISMIFQQMYSVVDTIVAGRFIQCACSSRCVLSDHHAVYRICHRRERGMLGCGVADVWTKGLS